ncbi:DUF2508 family protein [Zhaonella formicivorans]|jgi:hypothetical protein|uniref:DUF2508 family protein n=1 Tax=Zhaonella formicivorans TaxID=2528593 RepID=UPI0010D880C7|nr:DUF2508 family protein [Zhaonella formicivorans]
MREFDLSQLIGTLKEQLKGFDEAPGEDPKDSLSAALKAAKEEWDNARNFFNHVTEQDLIDAAIYQMEAAERKFIHLLKLFRNESLAK